MPRVTVSAHGHRGGRYRNKTRDAGLSTNSADGQSSPAVRSAPSRAAASTHPPAPRPREGMRPIATRLNCLPLASCGLLACLSVRFACVCLPLCLSSFFGCLPIYLPIRRSALLSAYLPVRRSVLLSGCLAAWLPGCLPVFAILIICLQVHSSRGTSCGSA